MNEYTLQLEPIDNQRLAELCGQFNEHLKQLESHLGVEIQNRGHTFQLIGQPDSIRRASEVLKGLYAEAKEVPLTPNRVHLFLQQTEPSGVAIRTRLALVKPRSPRQERYIQSIQRLDVNFGIGPAGTGKTYLAVACAVDALEKDQVSRLVLVRPAVEAGERLGFLPGDLAQKVDPYLRPLYDALYEMLGFERVAKLIERNIIEVAPLAYMRGRTLNEAFVILDEAQNTTVEQMKMFLTRLGFGSKAVITGDVTQVDLPPQRTSGLRHAMEVLKDIDDIGFTFFASGDVVRHPLVQRIVSAYASHEG